jgi:hypothetical protein
MPEFRRQQLMKQFGEGLRYTTRWRVSDVRVDGGKATAKLRGSTTDVRQGQLDGSRAVDEEISFVRKGSTWRLKQIAQYRRRPGCSEGPGPIGWEPMRPGPSLRSGRPGGTGAEAEHRVERTATREAGEDRHDAQKPPRGLRADERHRQKAHAEGDADGALDGMFVYG